MPRIDKPKWKGTCAWCGVEGDATSLFGFFAGPVPEEAPPESFCCPIRETDCLDQWLAANGKPPWFLPHEESKWVKPGRRHLKRGERATHYPFKQRRAAM
jgi:hypothetical protein